MRFLTLALAALLAAGPALAQRPAAPTTTARPVTTRATGTFEVQLAPQPADAHADGALLGRLTIDKQFAGDLEGTSKGQMLTAMTATKGSAGYVAIERVTGTLAGRRGTFVLQHSGTMHRGAQSLTLTVVPDSGTEGLEGIAGSMQIVIEGKRHSYVFEYSLAAGG